MIHFGAGRPRRRPEPVGRRRPRAASRPSKVEFLRRAAHAADRRPRRRRPARARRAGAHAARARHQRRLRALRRAPASGRASGCSTRSCGGWRASRPPTRPTATPPSPRRYRRLAERLHPYIDDGPVGVAGRPARPRSPAGAPLVLFDLAGLPDALAGPVMLTLVDFIDRDVQRRRAEPPRRTRSASAGPWAGRAFVAIDEAWKPLLTPAAGAWLNEWARRTRHLACALLVITQHLADFANAQGDALLRNSRAAVVLPHRLRRARLRPRRARPAPRGPRRHRAPGDAQGRVLHLPARLRSPRPRARSGSTSATWSTGPARADPDRDQPIRQLALAEADGDAWEALRRLVDPAWHHDRAAEAHRSRRVDARGRALSRGAADGRAAARRRLAPAPRAAAAPQARRAHGRAAAALVAVAGRRCPCSRCSAWSRSCSCCSPAPSQQQCAGDGLPGAFTGPGTLGGVAGTGLTARQIPRCARAARTPARALDAGRVRGDRVRAAVGRHPRRRRSPPAAACASAAARRAGTWSPSTPR